MIERVLCLWVQASRKCVRVVASVCCVWMLTSMYCVWVFASVHCVWVLESVHCVWVLASVHCVWVLSSVHCVWVLQDVAYEWVLASVYNPYERPEEQDAGGYANISNVNILKLTHIHFWCCRRRDGLVCALLPLPSNLHVTRIA